MHAEFGNYLLVFALCISICLSVFPMWGAFANNRQLILSAKPLTVLLFTALFGSFICLVYAFYIDDFTIAYVAQNSNSMLPDRYKFSAVWGAHEGSFLLWTLIFSGWAIAVALFGKNLPAKSHVRVLSVLGMIGCGFVSFLLFTSNPFDRTLPFFPVDGGDLNPLLQDFGLIIHPPLLYMGYVGFAVSFAFAITALIEGEWTSNWARATRPWTIAAWSFLTLGVMLGSWWAYYELGWGGWWFWDPSENASFIPWLSGTALMHSLAVTDKRNSFKGWTLALSLSTFSLSLLGTFLIRSGVLTSVHAFASDPARGRFILIFLALVVGTALLLFLFRSSKVKTKADFSELSKDMFLLLNNILLVSATFFVLFGTLYPLLAEVIGKKMSVGAPYFNSIFPIPMILLFILLGVGPLLNWKKHDASTLKKPLIKIALISVVLGLLSSLIAGEFYLWVMVGLSLSLWVSISSFYNLNLMSRHKKTLSKKLSSLSGTQLGMTVAHIGVVVTLAGVVLTSFHSEEKDLRMAIGESKEIAGYNFSMKEVQDLTKDNYQATRVIFDVSRNGEFLLSLAPEKRFYLAKRQIMTEADIDAGFHRDLYIALGEALDNSGNVWSVRIYVKSFIRWIWGGAILMALGGFLAMMDKRYRKLKAENFAKISEDESKPIFSHPVEGD
ncbi:MAG: heme lyase CcmF/NrfE family subunit [Kangiellaceae bacterium]|nr:heme lyase CcmF/NrfE family subunit [Kangiellaceae bacterium]